uniref:LAGLIDADG homing endonuclease n=1 Tax=Cyathus striatus TaxID=68777 RepID=UPI0023F0AB96|nr:LAGLIDADG homing endonuclease [Cyathus striatus]YP_010721276.1 LAGLIDADG homing endonuclease [Cyathus jiayuguanensis]WDS46392.1 LAGLIDADG homing endonuclease [Cyathus striatus]WDS46470.1 LAGLIDADG homing endonuclease [Cyathus jiayuguanensis]
MALPSCSSTILLYNNVVLTSIQKDVLVGTLLGDACMERDKPTHNSRVRFDQTYPNHEEYLLSLYEIFKDFTGTPPKIQERKPDKRTNKIYKTIAFKSLRYSMLNYYYDLYYKYDENNKRYKSVPINIKELLNARALASWIMVDGSIESYGSTQLHTDKFSFNELKLLQETLSIKFNLRTRLIKKTTRTMSDSNSH